MAMSAEEIISLIKASLPDAHVEMTDLAGDNDHWKAVVTSSGDTYARKLTDAKA